MKQHYDIVVIGGGVIGTATAFHLARGGADVALLERDALASGTSGATMSNLSLHNRMPGPEWDLALGSWQIYQELQREAGYDCEFEIVSSLMLIESEADLPWAIHRVKLQREAGLDVELLGPKELLRLDPLVSSNLAGAVYCQSSAWVNSLLLCSSLAAAAKQAGAKIHTSLEVNGILVRQGRVTTVQTSKGPMECECIVNAAGQWAPRIGSLVGYEVPLLRNRGTILITQKLPQFGIRIKGEGIDHDRIQVRKLAAIKASTNRNGLGLEANYDVHFVFTQTKSGNCLIGRSGEDHQGQQLVPLEAVKAIVQKAVRFVPALARASVIRAFAGIRPYSPDKLPILGPVSYPEGFYLACGFGDKGIGLGAAGAKLVADLILEGKGRIPETLAPQRFETPRE